METAAIALLFAIVFVAARISDYRFNRQFEARWGFHPDTPPE